MQAKSTPKPKGKRNNKKKPLTLDEKSQADVELWQQTGAFPYTITRGGDQKKK